MEELNSSMSESDSSTGLDSTSSSLKEKKNLTQSKLAFSKHAQHSNAKVLETTAVDLTTQRPDSFNLLMPYFEMICVNTVKDVRKYTMRCLVCVEVQSKALSVITDKGITSFARHLERNHKEHFNQYLEAKNTKKEPKVSAQPLITSSISVPPYARNDPRQKRFEQDLVNFIILDMRPFSLVEGFGFRKMIHNLDKKIIVPSRTSVQRWIDQDYQMIQKRIKAKLAGAPEGTLHFILDIWTSQQGKPIIGVKVQFVGDWKINQVVVGFKHFPGAHTAENIRTFVDKFLGLEMGIIPAQVASVTADNAANILAAFRVALENESDDKERKDQSLSTGPTNLSIHDSFDEFNEDEDMVHLEECMMQGDDENSEKMACGVEAWAKASISRNSCLAHLLHLTVKDTIKKSSLAARILKKVTETVTFFHKSPKWTDSLCTNSGGVALVRPVETRWSSFYNALARILQIKDNKPMYEAINETLVSAKRELPKRSRTPQIFSDDDVEAISVLVDLLKPCSDFTNTLQSDQVTSSVVILGVIDMTKRILAVDIDCETNHAEELDEFKSSLSGNIAQRFSTSPKDLPKTGDRGRRIVTVNVFQNPTYIIATLLDCRIKTSCFEESFKKDTIFFEKIPTKEMALQILKQAMEEMKNNEESSETLNVELPPQVDKSEEPPKKKPKGMFALLSTSNEVMESPSSLPCNEIEDYLALGIESGPNVEHYSPLLFWKKHESKFPFLSAIAKKVLGMPASSGAAERLFSVATGMGKARNARLSPKTTEKLLCCQSYRLNDSITF